MANYMAAVEVAKAEQEQQYKDAKSALMLELGLSESSEEEDPNAPPIVIPDIQPSEAGWETQPAIEGDPGREGGSEAEVDGLTIKAARPLITMR
jgi:hypothetical protein